MSYTTLLILGLLLNSPEGSLWQGLNNRAVAPFAIWITALLLYQYKHTEETLRDSEERYRAFVAQSFDAIWRFEFEPPIPITLSEDEQIERLYQNGYLAECNDVMAQMYGFSSVDELVGVRLETLMPRSEPDSITLQRTFTRAEYRLVDEESHKVDPQGNSKIFLNNMLGIIEDGRLVRTWGSQRDVTDRKQLEERLLQTQKMAAIGTLAGGIAHDFNNILAAILGFTEIALSDIAPNSQVRPHLQEVLRAGKRAKELVRQILTFSRQSEQRQQPVRLPELIREVLTMLRASLPATIEIKQHLDPGVGTVMADPTQIHQVLMNLFANAEHAMRASGGTLEVGLETAEVAPGMAAIHPDLLPGRYIRLIVQDTGAGMPAEVQERIFEPFFTTKQVGEGTGMGLAVVHGIVRHHNGTVTVESIPGQGTTFTLYLPCMPDSGEAAHKLDTAEPQGHGRVLFVDDEDSLAHLGRAMLTRLGYNVTAYTNSLEALAAFQATPYHFDLVITDQTMPRMNGETLARELRRLRPDLPIILCAGYRHVMDAEKASRKGIDAFLFKPLEIQILARTIADVLQKRAPEPTTF